MLTPRFREVIPLYQRPAILKAREKIIGEGYVILYSMPEKKKQPPHGCPHL